MAVREIDIDEVFVKEIHKELERRGVKDPGRIEVTFNEGARALVFCREGPEPKQRYGISREAAALASSGHQRVLLATEVTRIIDCLYAEELEAARAAAAAKSQSQGREIDRFDQAWDQGREWLRKHLGGAGVMKIELCFEGGKITALKKEFVEH